MCLQAQLASVVALVAQAVAVVYSVMEPWYFVEESFVVGEVFGSLTAAVAYPEATFAVLGLEIAAAADLPDLVAVLASYLAAVAVAKAVAVAAAVVAIFVVVVVVVVVAVAVAVAVDVAVAVAAAVAETEAGWQQVVDFELKMRVAVASDSGQEPELGQDWFDLGSRGVYGSWMVVASAGC
ncbi:hypothetical protein GUJ93_ZPchr0006g42596 [Zizania palustris]|uniref:Uncharacterized protein n=1 Tax=Zizania palustris TaxID=103762 RepID=A0A8J5VP64_ZIZPA|nr:hypothetical protein GUJ93_ZPchr0006g42596 [Zizania palustris]